MTAVTRIGPASLALPFNGAALAGDQLVVVTRNVQPPQVAAVDAGSWDVTTTADLPRGIGAWGVAAAGRAVYLGLQQESAGGANLYRYDLDTGGLTGVAALATAVIWDLAVAGDGTVFGVAGGMAPFVYDPRTRRARLVAAVPPGTEILRSVAEAGGRVVVGGRRAGRALLLAIEPATGATTDVLPPGLAGDRTVYTLTAGRPGEVVAGTDAGSGTAAVARVPLGGGRPEVVRLEGERVVDALSADGARVYATARPSGSVWVVEGQRARRLGTGAPNAEHRGLFRHRGRLVGVSAAERVFRMGVDGGDVEVVDLVERGLEPRPELAQSMAARDGTLWVGGNFSLQRIDVASGVRARAFVPGEPKDLLAVDGGVYLALYPGGEVWWQGEEGGPERVAGLPPEHNRPVSLAREEPSGLLLVTVASDRLGTGALCVVDPGAGTATPLPHPFTDAARAPAGLAVADGVAYVGAARDDPLVAALSLPGGERRWETGVAGAQTMIGLAVTHGRVFGFSPDGTLVVLDAADGRVLHREQLPHPGGRLAAAGGAVYGAGRDTLVRLDPDTLAWEVVLGDLAAEYWNHAFLAADTERVYVLQARDAVAVPHGDEHP